MWNRSIKNKPLNLVALLPSNGNGIKINSDSGPGQPSAPIVPRAATLSAFAESLMKQYFLHLLEEGKNALRLERELLKGKIFKEHLKEFTHSMTSEKHTDHFGDNPNFIQDFFRKIKAKSSLLRIKRKINELAGRIDAPRKLRPSYGSFDYDVDSFFIEIDKKGVMRLIETEKGQVHEVRRTLDLDELLYWIFTNITFSMAFKLAIEKPIGSMDRRKLIFQFQEELLGKLNPKWKEKIHTEYKEFLKNHPSDDIKGRGIDYYEVLRKQIRAEIVEKSASYFRFPKP